MSLLPNVSSFFTNSWMPQVTSLMTAISMNNVNNLGLNKNIINDFKSVTQDSIRILSTDLDYSKSVYYNYTKQKPSNLMDKIHSTASTLRLIRRPFSLSMCGIYAWLKSS